MGLLRILHHVRRDDQWYLYEQLDKVTGEQYNAEGLTWSYAEFLGALVERSQVWPCLQPPSVGCLNTISTQSKCILQCDLDQRTKGLPHLKCSRDAKLPDFMSPPTARPWYHLLAVLTTIGVVIGFILGGGAVFMFDRKCMNQDD